MARQFFARVYLQGVEDTDEAYDTVAEELGKQGFTRTFKLAQRTALLPPGTFVCPAEQFATSEEALRVVQRAAKSVGLPSAIVVIETDQPVQTSGLDNAPAPH
jgi:hypothetical protein